jgi:hypothetical protein
VLDALRRGTFISILLQDDEGSMIGRARADIAWHVETASRVLARTPAWVLLVPVAGMLAIYALNLSPALAPYLTKPEAEFISPIILGLAFTMAAILATWMHPYYTWQAAFAFALLLRELHFQGTNTGFYIALVLLLGWASYARERLEPFFSDKRIVTLLMAVLWTYLVSKTFDRRYWDALLPRGTSRDLFEENLEVLGHVLFLLLVAVSVVIDVEAPARRIER